MKNCLPLFILCLYSFSVSAQGFPTVRPKKAKTRADVVAEFQRAAGTPDATFTADPGKAILYITSDKQNVELFAVTNFRASESESPRLKTLGGLLDTNELRSLFQGAPGDITLTNIPLLVDNEVFTTFATTDPLLSFREVSVVTKSGLRFPFRHRFAEIKPGMFAYLSINLENFNKFLFERTYAPESVRVLSLLNNAAVNNAFEKVFPRFQAVRTVDQVEKAIGTSKEPVIFVLGHFEDNQLIRYRLEGAVSYALPVRQFQNMAIDLKKEMVMIGCNYADNPDQKPPKGVINAAEEITLLAEALKGRQFGPMLYTLGKEGKDSITVQMGSSQDYKNAEIRRNTGGKITAAYNFIFFDTHPYPTFAARAPRLMFKYAGVIFLFFTLFQALCFWVFKGRWVYVMKWINWGLMLFFAFCFLLSSFMGV